MTAETGGTLGTWRRFVFDRSTSIFRAYWGSRFMGTIGWLFDKLGISMLDAVQAPWLQMDDGPAYDALRPLGQEQSMPQYPIEDWVTYRNRLRTVWQIWPYAGDERAIIDQLAAAGRPGAQIFRFSETGSWSDFVVFYPAGSHPVTGSKNYGASGNYGDSGLTYGVDGITAEELVSYKELIKHWKPARWKCPWIIWEIRGSTYGTGHTYGEAGLTYGGEQERTQVQI